MGSVIIGATSVAQLLENIDACLLDIDAATEAALDQLYIKHGNTTLCD
jgi:aryl-alcohol dehydrogenase-like predicted oxidoreductase